MTGIHKQGKLERQFFFSRSLKIAMEFGDMIIHAKVKKKNPNNQMKKEDSNLLVIYELQKN